MQRPQRIRRKECSGSFEGDSIPLNHQVEGLDETRSGSIVRQQLVARLELWLVQQVNRSALEWMIDVAITVQYDRAYGNADFRTVRPRAEWILQADNTIEIRLTRDGICEPTHTTRFVARIRICREPALKPAVEIKHQHRNGLSKHLLEQVVYLRWA